MVDFNFQQCEADSCIFVHTNTNEEKTYIALYINDFLIAEENKDDIATIKGLLGERFEMKDLSIAERFLGMEIEYGEEDGSVKLHQEGYLRNLLMCHGMQNCNPISMPLDTSVKLTKATDIDPLADSKEYASIVGGLMFATCVTRPDIMCAVGQLSQFLNKPTSRHLLAAKRILRYLKGTFNLGIRYGHPATPLVEFSDADWAGNLLRYCVFIGLWC